MLPMGKINLPGNVDIQSNKELDIMKMIGTVAHETMNDIASAYYTNGRDILGEEQADQALQRVKGRMQTLKALVQFVS